MDTIIIILVFLFLLLLLLSIKEFIVKTSINVKTETIWNKRISFWPKRAHGNGLLKRQD